MSDILVAQGVNMPSHKNKKECECPNCGTWGVHYWHHVLPGVPKKKQEQYNAVVYWCWACHVTNTDSIHNNAKLRHRLKQEHQRRIMQEQGWTEEEFRQEFGESYLYERSK